MMIVRFPAEDDINDLAKIIRETHADSLFSDLPIDEGKVERLLREAVSGRGGQIVVLAECRSGIVGAIHAVIGQHIICGGGQILSIQNLLVAKRIRGTLIGGRVSIRLLSAVTDLGRSRGAVLGTMNAMSGISPKGVHRIAGKIGMKVVGGNYAGKI